jgi:hypothetical protein
VLFLTFHTKASLSQFCSYVLCWNIPACIDCRDGLDMGIFLYLMPAHKDQNAHEMWSTQFVVLSLWRRDARVWPQSFFAFELPCPDNKYNLSWNLMPVVCVCRFRNSVCMKYLANLYSKCSVDTKLLHCLCRCREGVVNLFIPTAHFCISVNSKIF